MAQLLTFRLTRNDPSQSWGFRLQGGKDFGTPLLIQKVNAGSLAERAGLKVGDALLRVNSVEVGEQRHKDAQDVIIKAGNAFDVTVQRGGLVTWKPAVSPVGSIPSPNPYASSVSPTPVTKTSLAATYNPGSRPPHGFNAASKPFSPQLNGGIGTHEGDNSAIKAIVNKQYNSPVGIYSDESIAETLSAQAEVLAGGVLGVNFKKNEKNYNAEGSEVFKMLRESENESHWPEAADEPRSDATESTADVALSAPPPLLRPKSPQPPPSSSADGSSLAPGKNTCADCERLIVGVFVRIKGKNLHVECFKCATCGTSLKNVGYYSINEKLYCDIHAKMVARQNAPAGSNLEPVTEPSQSRPLDRRPWKNSPSPSRFVATPSSVPASPSRFASPFAQPASSANGNTLYTYNASTGAGGEGGIYSTPSTVSRNVDSFKTVSRTVSEEKKMTTTTRTTTTAPNNNEGVSRAYAANVAVFAANVASIASQRLPFLRPRDESHPSIRSSGQCRVQTPHEGTIDKAAVTVTSAIETRTWTSTATTPTKGSAIDVKKCHEDDISHSVPLTGAISAVENSTSAATKNNLFDDDDEDDRAQLNSACSREIARILSESAGIDSSDENFDGDEKEKEEEEEEEEEEEGQEQEGRRGGSGREEDEATADGTRAGWHAIAEKQEGASDQRWSHESAKSTSFLTMVGAPHAVRPLSPYQAIPRPDQIVVFPPPQPLNFHPPNNIPYTHLPVSSAHGYLPEEFGHNCADSHFVRNVSDDPKESALNIEVDPEVEADGSAEEEKIVCATNSASSCGRMELETNFICQRNTTLVLANSHSFHNIASNVASNATSAEALSATPLRGGSFASALTIAPERPFTPLQSAAAATIFSENASLPEPTRCYSPHKENGDYNDEGDAKICLTEDGSMVEEQRPRLADALTTINDWATDVTNDQTIDKNTENAPSPPSLNDDPSEILRRPSSVAAAAAIADRGSRRRGDSDYISRYSLRQELETKMDEKRAVWRAERRPRIDQSEAAASISRPLSSCEQATPTNFEATICTRRKVFVKEEDNQAVTATVADDVRLSSSPSQPQSPSLQSASHTASTSYHSVHREHAEHSTTLLVAAATICHKSAGTATAPVAVTAAANAAVANAAFRHLQSNTQHGQQQQQQQKPQQHRWQEETNECREPARMGTQATRPRTPLSQSSSPLPRRRLSSVAEECGSGGSGDGGSCRRTTSREAAASLLSKRLATSLPRAFGGSAGATDGALASPSAHISTAASADECANRTTLIEDNLGYSGAGGKNIGGGKAPPFGAHANATASPSSAGLSAPRRGKGVWNPQNAAPGARIPLCARCNSQIRGPFVTALGKIWCPEHFVCVNDKCGRSLLDIGFVEEPSGLYCEYCFERYLAPTCAKCGDKIKADCLNAIGRHFHPNCFTCAYCSKLFGNDPFFLEDGLPYCENDWNELFTTKCFACGFPIEAGDRWVEALQNNYHSPCFNCTAFLEEEILSNSRNSEGGGGSAHNNFFTNFPPIVPPLVNQMHGGRGKFFSIPNHDMICKTNLEGQSFYAKAGRPYCKMHSR